MLFKKGHIPANKGKKGWSNGGTFKKGHGLIGGGCWKGDNASYSAIHKWIRKYKGKPQKCEFCGKEKTTPRSIHWANKDHKYSRNRDDWMMACLPCHAKYDQ